MPAEAEDRYRKKYLDLLDELDNKEKRWAELEARVRRILTHLLIMAEGPAQSEISGELASIKESLKKGMDLGEIERLVEALKDRVLRETPWVQGGPEFPPVHQVLIHLVERLPLPGEMAEKSVAVVEILEGGISPAQLPGAIDSVVGLILEARGRIQDEKRELETLLQEITGRLEELDQGFTAAHQVAEHGFTANRTLDAAVRAEVQGLETSARRLADLESLRRAVSSTLESIRGHLEAKSKEDEARKEDLRREVDRLRENIAGLEREVADQREKVKAAREASMRDALTGCYNRLAYLERAKAEEARTSRYGSALSLLILDVDRFKLINDTFGHKAGDQVLKAIAHIVGGQLRQADFFARYGGEEFVALLPETPLAQALVAAEKVRKAVEAFRFHSHGKRVVITLSCGLAQLRPAESIDDAFERADRALYHAKGEGRNRSATEEDLPRDVPASKAQPRA